MKAIGKNPKFSGLALGLVIIGAAGALAGLWWTSTWRADVNFLPAMTPAEWIVFPITPDGDSHRRLELPTAFEHSFVLDRVPSRAVLRIAGFHRYTLAINGTSLEKPAQTGINWKRPDAFDVAGQLLPGTNRIEVTVFNSDGPPALWLSLDAGGTQVNSGNRWRASLAGATWRAAVPAAEPKPMATGSVVYRLPRPWISLGMRWPTLLVFTLLSATGFWLLRKGAAVWTFLPIDGGSRGLPKVAQASQPASSPLGNCATDWLREILPVAVLAALWVALFANNLGALPRLTGFDAQGHLDYIRYLQEHGSLPLANQGWEMFQPPLYYLLSAAWLGLLHLSVADAGGLMALRILGLAIGVAHLAIVWATLRLLFPAEQSKAGWGILLAACLPPMLYLSQYVTNEAFAAMMVSACVGLTLRALKQEPLQWISCAWLGLSLGGALLAKSTAFLVLPPVLCALLWKWLEKRAISPAQMASRVGLIIALCTLVGGWHYVRLWVHYGNPLIGVWDPKLAIPWWQEDGFRTSTFYLQFGDVLFHPWSAAWRSYGDGIYATLWGDGMLSGAGDFFVRPPWNCELMAIGYWLALLPTLAVLAGAILAVFKFIQRPSAEWFFLLGFGLIILGAMVYLSLILPYYCHVKAFYGLSALVPFCVFGALGLDLLTRRNTNLQSLVCIVFGLWAINTYASFWISRSSVVSTIRRASVLMGKRQYLDATDFLKQRLRSEFHNTDLRFTLAYFLTITGRVDEGIREAEMFVQEHPDDCRGHYVLALAFSQEQQTAKTIAELRQVMALAPGFDPSWENFIPILIAPDRTDEAINVCRQALAMAPYSASLRLALGSDLLLQNLEVEGAEQLRYAYLLNPESVNTLADLAWKLATSPQPAERNRTVAVKLAEAACALTGCSQTRNLGILAAVDAETGRYAEAISAAERAEASALASGDPDSAAATRDLLQRLKAGQPNRER